MADNGNDWKVWAIRLGFGIIATLLPITLSLAALSYYNLKNEFSKDVNRLEVSLDAHTKIQMAATNKQTEKIDTICQKLSEHDTLLRLPYVQRKEFFLFPKVNEKVLP